jgi:hypothetical protein
VTLLDNSNAPLESIAAAAAATSPDVFGGVVLEVPGMVVVEEEPKGGMSGPPTVL